MLLDPNIWGPKYWFFIHTTAMNYSDTPTETTKRKYYDFIQNLPLFIPDQQMAAEFVDLLDKYPVSSYLDSRASFTRWIHFIHNKINRKLGKPEPTYPQFMEDYYRKYYAYSQDCNSNMVESTKKSKVIIGIAICLLILIYLISKNYIV